MATARDAVTRVCGKGTVTCRFTHAYPDGPAPYYTILAPGKRGSQLEQWDEIKAAVSDKLIARRHDHASSFGRPRPSPMVRPSAARTVSRRALKAAKRALDPHGILNPGVLIRSGSVAREVADR